MEQPNQWLTPTEQEGLDYMYQHQEGGHVTSLEQQFPEPPLPDHQEQYYTPPMAAPSFHPPRSSNFPTFGGSSSLPNLPFRAATVKNELGQPSPPPQSSNFLSFGTGQASTLNFSGGAWQPDGIELTMQVQEPERRSRAPGNAQEHVIAERKRREKLQQQFVSLATIVPGLKKTDKISLLGGTIEYVKQLEEKVKALEEQGARRSSESTVFESKCSISAANSDAAGPSGSGTGDGDGEYSSPAVEVSIRGNTVLLKICCKERRGVLVMVLSELENQGLSIINTNVVPFTDSCLNITITAKAGPLFSGFTLCNQGYKWINYVYNV
ncbi:transcription factor bHLH19-like [Lolium rigidum]|uniref:transcription factor bHLH19-like n=1 Tax=Lolium rigidum TaxID=89674 RepID=UPI001F5D1825|nr:transcription factor bHLH19-like [Lolium rigidum]